MSLIFSLNYHTVPDEDVKKIPPRDEIVASSQSPIGASLDISLDNADPATYDPNYSGSLFYGADWYNTPATIYDDQLGVYIWKGLIRNIKTTADRQVVVTTVNYLYLLGEVACVYSNASAAPAQHILNLVEMIVPAENINYGSFQSAINIQTAASALASVALTSSNKRNCLDAIYELQRMSICEVYSIDNIIYCHQWQQWDGSLGTRINADDIQDYEDEYENDPLYTNYSVKYKSGSVASTTVLYSDSAGDSDSDIILDETKNYFYVPDGSDNSSTALADYPIIYLSKAAADWAGALAVSRWGHIRKVATFKMQNEYSYIHLHDQLDLNRQNVFGNEPATVVSQKYDRENYSLTTKVEFLNNPVQVVERDTVPPSSPQLVTLLPGDGRIIVKWSVNTETDIAGYMIYFTTTIGEWRQEYCHAGVSPVEVKSPDISDDGYNQFELREIQPGAKYYVKVTAFDTSYNESEFSNILSIYTVSDNGNRLNLTGTPFTGLVLSASNAKVGTVPAGFLSFPFDLPADLTHTAVYESPEYYHPAGFATITWYAVGAVEYQLSRSDDGETWTAWSTAEDAAGLQQIVIASAYFRIRFVFNSLSWADDDTVTVRMMEAA